MGKYCSGLRRNSARSKCALGNAATTQLRDLSPNSPFISKERQPVSGADIGPADVGNSPVADARCTVGEEGP